MKTRRKTLSDTEMHELENRVRAIMRGVTTMITFDGHRYFPVSNASYAECFGILQGLDAIGLWNMKDSKPWLWQLMKRLAERA